MLRKKYFFIFLFLLQVGIAQSQWVEYHNFGYYTYYSYVPLAYKNISLTGVRQDFSFCSTYEIKHNSRNIETVELNYNLNKFKFDQFDYNKSSFVIGMAKETRYPFNSKYHFIQSAGVSFLAYSFSDITENDFKKTFLPLYEYLGEYGVITNIVGTPKFQDFGVNLNIDFGLRILLKKQNIFDMTIGVLGQLDFEKIKNIVPIPVNGIYTSYSGKITFKWTKDREFTQPFILYRLYFFDTQTSFFSDYHREVMFRHQILIGIKFKFSLLIFG